MLDCMNPLSVFLAPGKTVRDTLEHPNLAVSVVLVLLPNLVLLGLAAVLGFRISPQVPFNAAKGLVFWIATSLALYLLLYLLKGKSVQGKLTGLLGCMALTRLFSAAILVLLALFAFVLTPTLFAGFKQLQNTSFGLQDIIQVAKQAPVQSNALSLGFSFFILVLGVVFLLESIYVWYAAIAAAGPSGVLKNALILGLALVISGILAGFLG